MADLSKDTIQLILDMGQSGRNVDEVREALGKMESSAKSAAKSAEQVEKAAEKTSSGGMKSLSRGALQTSQALQDVAQGGPAAALNNVDGIVNSLAKGMGLSATSATALAAGLLGVGTAALVLGPPLLNWYKALRDGRNEIPQAVDLLDAYTAAVKRNKDALSGLAEKGYLTDSELPEYNRLLAEQADLEAKAARAKEAKAAADRMAAIQDARDVERQQAQVATLKALVGGDGKRLIDDVAKSMESQSAVLDGVRAKLAQINKAYKRRIELGFDETESAKLRDQAVAAQNAVIAGVRQRMRDDASLMVDDAVTKGSESQLKAIIDRVGPDSPFANDLRAALSETRTRAQAEDDAEWETYREASKRRQAYDDKETEAENAAYQQSRKVNEALKPFDTRFEGIETYDDLVNALVNDGNVIDPEQDQADFETEYRLATAARRSALRKPINQVALSYGVDLNYGGQLEEAANLTEMYQGQGAEKGEAMLMAIQQIVENQQRLADYQNQQQGQWRQIQQQAQNVPSLMQFGTGY